MALPVTPKYLPPFMDQKLELKRTRTLRKQTGQIDNLLKSYLMRMRPWLNGNKEALEFKFHHVWGSWKRHMK
ncbi:hypothetical protein F383_17535 [Gossypium arboreum]|uniref:Uncharacterized protein n=1 Tax=Gossypium arboreum TaxID=29729 RepID=A0A0B0NH62_GOSAR|nr:hypothetical protein F383_17535 [Gossypium arboreum]